MVGFFGGIFIGVLIGVIGIAMLRMSTDVEDQKAEDLTNI
jgi:hypothetical protein